MKDWIVLVAVVFVACANGASISGRVVGGTDAPEGAYPYQVSLRVLGEHMCGGSIINNRYILTAGHCGFLFRPSDVEVIVGINKLSAPGTQYSVDTIKVHENFDFWETGYDIALFRTTKEIEFNDLVQPISLPSVDSTAGEKVVLTGWGMTSFPGNVSDILQQVDVVVIDIDVCKEAHSLEVHDTNVCTSTESGKGSCYGDSGGPLADPKTNSIVGIASWGEPCAVGLPDVFTRVYSYLDWIAKIKFLFKFI